MTARRRVLSLALAMALAMAFGRARAEGASPDSTGLGGRLIRFEEFKPVELPTGREIDAALESLDVGDVPSVYTCDLDADGRPDWLVQADPALCGTGGCPYALIRGRDRRCIGSFFGQVAILDARINGMPVIQALSKHAVEATLVVTYVFDGYDYRPVADAVIEELGMLAWRARMR